MLDFIYLTLFFLKANEGAEKPSDYEYYDQSQGDNRYMQSLRRNSINRGIRSDSDYESLSKF